MAARDPKSSRTGMRTRREMYMISTYIKLLRDEGYDNRDIWVMIHEYERGKGRTTGLAEQVAKEVGIDPAPPGWKVKRRQEPLKLYKNPEAAEPVRVRFKEVEEPAPQPRRNVRIREPAPEPPPSPPRPPRYVESNLEPLHVAPRRLGSDVPKIRNQPQTLEQALQTRIQRRAFRKANRKRYWELGGRYGHPQFPRYRQFPTGEEKQAITTSEKRMRRHAERYRRNPHAMRTIRSQDKPQNEPPNPGDSTSNPIPPLSSNPPVHRPDITGMPRSALIRIIELLPSESQIRLALAIPGTFQSPTAVNVFTLDAERQMKYLRRLRRHMRGGPQVTLPLLSEAIHDTSLDVNDISQILDGYAAHSGDVLNDMYLHRGFPPPLVAAIYASEMLESERLRRCPMRVAHNRCRAPHGFPRTYTDCPSLIHHAIYVHGVRYYSQMTDGSPPGSEENERNRVRRDNTEDTVAVMAFCERLHRLDQRGTDSAIAKGLEALIETGLYRAIGYLVDQMVKDIHVDESSRMKALNSLLMDFALEEIDTTGKSDGACREDRDRRDDLMRHLVAHGARIDTRHALDVAAVDGVHGHSFLVILGEIARINPNDNDEMYRYLANAKQSDNTRIFTVRLSRMMSGRVGDQARLLYATIRDGALRTYECLIANKTAVASRQAMYMAIERDDLNILGQLMALPDKPSADKDAPPNDGFVGPVYNAIGKPDDPADLIARQGRNILEAALVMRKFDVAHFLIQKGFPTAIDKAVLERVQLGAQELAKSIEPMTAEALKAAGEPPLDSGRILPIMTGSAGDAEAERTYNEMVESFKALVSILNKANDKANDKVNGKVLEIAVVGAGPRGTSVLERMCASVAEIIPAGTELIIHVITPCPAGAGKLWRTDLPTTLITGTIASEMTLYTDGTVKCQGPIRPGPTLYEWVQSNRPEHGLGPDDYVPRALYGEYLSWGFNQMLAHPTDNVRIVMHEARATNLEEGPDGRELLSLSNGERLPGISAVILAEEHLPVHPTPEEEQIRAYAEKAGLTYIAPSMPHDVELSVVKAGEPVLMRGLGFAFMDYVTLLTLGRGGRFETVGTNLQYIPSGNEPRIYAGSPQGMPYLALGDNKKTAADYHEPFIFNDEVVDLLRERANLGHSLDFNIDIWPLMVKEVEMAYYDSLLGGGEEFSNEFREAFIDTQPSTDEESQVLNDFEFPADDRLRWEEFAYPYRSKTFASPDEWQKWLLEHLHDDVTQAEFGNTESPVKAAACALYDLGDKLRELISQARLTEESRRIIHNDFAPLYAFICRGPTRLQALQLIALIKANIVTIVGPELEVRYGPNSWTVDSPHIPGSQVSVTTLIEARVPSADVRRTGDELLWNMFKNKECRLHTMDGYESGGLDVTPRPFNIIDAQGVAHPRRFALGVPTDGAEWLNTTAPKPGRNSSTLLDSDAVARAALAIAAS